MPLFYLSLPANHYSSNVLALPSQYTNYAHIHFVFVSSVPLGNINIHMQNTEAQTDLCPDEGRLQSNNRQV